MAARKPATTVEQDKPQIIDALGVTITIGSKTFDDWHIVEQIADIEDNPTPALLVRFLRTILGAEQYKRAMKQLELEDGTLPVERVTAFLQELMEGLNPNS